MLKVESYKKGIILSIMFNVIAKALTFLNLVLIAFYFGSNETTDLYFFAYNIILLIGAFITQLNGTVIVPEAMRIRHISELQAMHFINFIVLFALSAGIILSLLVLIRPVTFYATVSEFSVEKLQNNYLLIVGMTALLPFIITVNFLTEIATSYKFFTMPMIAGAATNLLSIVAMTIGHAWMGVAAITVGLAVGYLINLLLLFLLMKTKMKWSFSLYVPKEKLFWKNMLLATAGNSVTIASGYIGLFLLSGFSAGTISALNFAQRVYEMPTSFVTNQFGSIAAIKFNELYPQKNYSGFDSVFNNSLKLLFVLLAPMTVALFYFPKEILTLIFQHGHFNPSSVDKSAEMLRVLSLMLPLLAINVIVTRALMATQRVDISFRYQMFNALVVIALTFVGVYFFDEIGYPFALVVSFTFGAFFLQIILKICAPFVKYISVLKALLAIILINTIWSGLAFGLVELIHVDDGVLRMLIFAIAFGLPYLVTLYFSPYRELLKHLKLKL